MDVITPNDVRAISLALLERAKSGDKQAARLPLDRVLGMLSVDRWESRERIEKDGSLAEV